MSVLEGGFRAWRKAGLPVEAVPDNEVVPLPKSHLVSRPRNNQTDRLTARGFPIAAICGLNGFTY